VLVSAPAFIQHRLPRGLRTNLTIGILGLIITALTARLPSLILGLWWIRTHFVATVDWISSTKILIASTTAAVITYIILSQLSFSSWIKLILGLTIFLPFFSITIILTRTINRSDINNLREMLSALGPLRRLFNSLLDLVEKLMTTLRL
jgi:hypothetical protein